MTADERALALIDDEGVDLSKPYELSHWMYFPQRAAADRLGQDLTRQGFRTTVQAAALGANWLLLAYQYVVVTDELLDDMRATLTDLAEEFGGNYDGWEMAVPTAHH